ncbi:MAG: penicillin amidase [Candidatus Hydrogenedentota bacterium]
MKSLRRIVMLLLVLLVLILFAVPLATYLLARAGMPVLEGEIQVAAIGQGVTITRDEWGVPHIEAENEKDAAYALGYAMAQDRLFQMEMLRRLAQGELAEIVGPAAVDIDRAMRTLRLRPKADENLQTLRAKYPEVFASCEAFLAGVNQYAATGPRPFEFILLGIPRRSYSLTDSLCIAGILPITFSYGPRQDAMYSMVQDKFPDVDVSLLFPGYSQEIPTTIMETREEAESILRDRGLWPPVLGAVPPATHASVSLQPFLDQWQKVSETLGSHLGSNSWVLAPSRTETGGAILANDPHIGYTNPSIWYEAYVQCPEFELYGYYLPLIPIALLGHNREMGWGLTMFANDDVDLFRETIDSANPNRVKYKGQWTDLQVEHETINVRFSADIPHDVRVTPHGPIITPLLEKYEDYAGAPVSLYWVWQHVEYSDIAAFHQMARSKDYESFASAVALITSPGVNVSYADKDGNIAWWAAGKLPVRPPHVNSKTLLDGATGLDDPLGFLPFDQNPHLKNPPSGFIATANNKSSVREFGPIASLEGYWQPWDRAERIENLIESKAKWSADDVMKMQNDHVAVAAPVIVNALVHALKSEGVNLSPKEQDLLNLLQSWDGSHDASSIEPTIYTYLCDAILANAIKDELGEKNLAIYATLGDAWLFLRYLVQSPKSPYWDDKTTPGEIESSTAILLVALRETIDSLEAAYSSDMRQWTWGNDHTLTFMHPLGFLPLVGSVFNLGPFPVSGGSQTINNLLHPHGTFRHKVIAGPSTRRVIDFSNPVRSHTILPTGNSGHWLSPHYRDQTALFISGEYREAELTPPQTAANNPRTLRLIPK